MTTQLTRRGILKALGIGAAAALIEEPIRKYKAWTAREGYQFARLQNDQARAREMNRECGPEPIAAARDMKRALHAEMDRIWDEAGREGRALPASWVFQNGSIIEFGGKS